MTNPSSLTLEDVAAIQACRDERERLAAEAELISVKALAGKFGVSETTIRSVELNYYTYTGQVARRQS